MAQRYRIPIEGMTCTSCVSRITKALRTLDGVEAVRVDLGTDSATLTLDDKRTSLDAVGVAVEAAGYEARIRDAVPVEGEAPRVGLLGRLGFGRGSR